MCINLASFRHKFGAETVHAFLIFAITQRVGIFQERHPRLRRMKQLTISDWWGLSLSVLFESSWDVNHCSVPPDAWIMLAAVLKHWDFSTGLRFNICEAIVSNTGDLAFSLLQLTDSNFTYKCFGFDPMEECSNVLPLFVFFSSARARSSSYWAGAQGAFAE